MCPNVLILEPRLNLTPLYKEGIGKEEGVEFIYLSIWFIWFPIYKSFHFLFSYNYLKSDKNR